VLWAKKDCEKGRVNPSPVGFEHADEDPEVDVGRARGKDGGPWQGDEG